MVQNGRIEIADIANPVMIPFNQNAVALTVLIMNCYLDDQNVKVTVSAGPYISSLSPNPAKPGDTITVQGLSFGATRGTSKVYLEDDEISEITSWNNTRIIFTLPNNAESGKVKVVVNGSASNEVQLEVEIEEPEPKTFDFISTWSVPHFPSGWGIEPDTIDFTATGSGRILNAINPVIEVKNYYDSHDKYVRVTNMRMNEVVTVEGTINVALSTYTVSPTNGFSVRYVYTYSNPRLILKKDGVLIEELPGMSFSWVFDAEQTYNNDIDLYVLYDIETAYYRCETEGGPFILQDGYPTTGTSEVFHLGIDLIKDLPNYATP